MGTTRTGRFLRLALSRQRTWYHTKKTETNKHTTVGSSTSDDTSGEEASDRKDVDGHNERSVDKA